MVANGGVAFWVAKIRLFLDSSALGPFAPCWPILISKMFIWTRQILETLSNTTKLILAWFTSRRGCYLKHIQCALGPSVVSSGQLQSLSSESEVGQCCWWVAISFLPVHLRGHQTFIFNSWAFRRTQVLPSVSLTSCRLTWPVSNSDILCRRHCMPAFLVTRCDKFYALQQLQLMLIYVKKASLSWSPN